MEAQLRWWGEHRALLAELLASVPHARWPLVLAALFLVALTTALGAAHGLAAAILFGAACGSVLTLAFELCAELRRTPRAPRGVATLAAGRCPQCGARCALSSEGSSCDHCAAPLWPDARAHEIARSVAHTAQLELEVAAIEHRMRTLPDNAHLARVTLVSCVGASAALVWIATLVAHAR